MDTLSGKPSKCQIIPTVYGLGTVDAIHNCMVMNLWLWKFFHMQRFQDFIQYAHAKRRRNSEDAVIIGLTPVRIG